MTDLERDLRSAFAVQQREFGPIGDAPRRLLHQGLHVPRRAPLLQVAGALAALLVIAAVAGIMMLTRQHTHGRPATTPSPAPSATPSPIRSAGPLSTPLSVPDTTPVILVRDPADRNQVDGITWDGLTVGRVTTLPPNTSMRPNPAGTRFVAGLSIFDRSGKEVAKLTGRSRRGPVWTDDGQQLCDIWDGPPPTLVLMTPSTSKPITEFPNLTSDQTAMSVAACSTRSDLAVVLNTGPIGSTTQYWVVQLSTGRIVSHRTLPADSQTYVVASPDAKVIAQGTIVYDAAGSEISTLPRRVVAFSADGSLAVLDGADGPSVVTITRGSTAKAAVLSGGAGLHVAGVYADPGDPQQVAIAVSPTGDAAGPDGYPGPARLWILGRNGTGIQGIEIRF